MSLQDILKTFKEEKVVVREGSSYTEKDDCGVSLKGVLQRGRLKIRKDKKVIKQGVGFRPSGITFRYCRRAKVGQLAGILDIYDEKPAPALQLVFDMGHSIHDIFQGYFWDIGLLRGSFRCIKCEETFDDLLAPKVCPKRKSHGRNCLSYREITLPTNDHMIRGRCDGIIEIEGEYHVVDFKSIANRTIKTPIQQTCFEDLEDGPKEDHVVQLMLYLHFLEIPRGHLMYIAKNDHKVKSFAVPYDYEIIRPYLDEITHLKGLAEGLLKGEQVQLPDICGREACPCDDVFTKGSREASSEETR